MANLIKLTSPDLLIYSLPLVSVSSTLQGDARLVTRLALLLSEQFLMLMPGFEELAVVLLVGAQAGGHS